MLRSRMGKGRLNTEWNRVPILNRYVEDAATGCWNWQGFTLNGGYGHIQVNKRRLVAHRYFYEQLVGPIPEGLFLCHTCDNRRCVNPAHLFPGTNSDNMQDASRKGRLRRNTKITREEARSIFQDARRPALVAAEYQICPSNVSMIQRGVTWRNATADLGSPRENIRAGSVLTEDQVRIIRQTRTPEAVLAKRFGVAQTTINVARRGLTWSDVE